MNAAFSITADEIRGQAKTQLIESSLVVQDGFALWLERSKDGKQVALLAPLNARILEQFEGNAEPFKEGYVLKRGATNAFNAAALPQTLPNLNPVPLGLTTSAGFGDRLGMATPGHARALQQVLGRHPTAEIAPIFAQQSIREMTRTHRSPQEVMDDATWGAFEAGWRAKVGADADHLKTTADIDACVEAGYSFFTIDPGEHVDDEAHNAPAATVEQKVEALPWAKLESSRSDLERHYVGQHVDLGAHKLLLDSEAVLRAAAKYGAAVAHVAMMYRHLASKHVPFELEVSVDETETPTSHVEHVYIASELERLGVKWISLAPRYVGRFEKGIDYLGDLQELTEDLAGHAAIVRALGPYKLSLHSGSDKFSVYPSIAKLTDGLVHLKTAGTSYLEALRVISKVNFMLFRQIGRFACERYEEDKKSYHVSADREKMPKLEDLRDEELASLLEQTDARQILHVTFGSVLDHFKGEIMAVLSEHEEAHYESLTQHFERHLEPFAEVIA